MLIAIPVVIAVQLAHDRWDLWWTPPALLVLSYAMQWFGHRVEGNDMGEVILIKKWLHRPYIAIAPRYERPASRKDAKAQS